MHPSRRFPLCYMRRDDSDKVTMSDTTTIKRGMGDNFSDTTDTKATRLLPSGDDAKRAGEAQAEAVSAIILCAAPVLPVGTLGE